ncbi:MAG: hypothetical protein AUI47_06070 [Acidobacteria bacterium 13_1_40CM_2_68_5]|nr:MAG: hypothetical protein AUI47_06070 [Acidobacteria bacterium 13_1_40CM_2_68_5]
MGMLKERKKELLLGALLVAIAVVVWQNLAGGGAPVSAGPAPGGPVPRVNLEIAKIYPVDWASMSAPRPTYDPNGRNIFTYGAIPVPTPPPLTPQEKEAIEKARLAAEEERKRQELLAQQAQAAAASQAQAAAQAQANQPPPAPPKPQPPPINYKFIGYVGPSENKIAVLHDGNDLIFVRAGEKIGGQFKILEIGYESIKFGYTDPRFKGETTTLPMSSSY